MKGKKRTDLKVVQFKELKEKKLLSKIIISDDEADLDVKINDLGHLFSIGETMVEEALELEKKIGPGGVSEDFVRFLDCWNATTEIFDEYYQKL